MAAAEASGFSDAAFDDELERRSTDAHDGEVFYGERHAPMLIDETIDTGSHWKSKDKMKTVYVTPVLCLNIGIKPPDAIFPDSCPRLEAWIDPSRNMPKKASEEIAKALELQYERWQPRAKFKTLVDPSVDELKKSCISVRRSSQSSRVLFHYNGHGVPKPTAAGELWVFNRALTQYVPVSMYDLQTWLGAPSVLVLDCSNAGTLVNIFTQTAQHRTDFEETALGAPLDAHARSSTPQPGSALRQFILIGACGVDENLPLNPNLPADLLTSCLTTPIKMALRWYLQRSPLLVGVSPAMIDKIPGKLSDRRTPLGELNWIFTTITDSIAWSVLPASLFSKLYRQDLLVASLFRNYLLAERIMKTANCTPVTYPELPPTYHHALWDAWDLAAENCLTQLPRILQLDDPSAAFQPCRFFQDQLAAFKLRLRFGDMLKKPPSQLPMVLQVLLSQSHRLKALKLLARFLDTGTQTVVMALSVGIFPYILKLLQSPAKELRKVLVFVWVKILAVDSSCAEELTKDENCTYFMQAMEKGQASPRLLVMCLFVLSIVCDQGLRGQAVCREFGLLATVSSLFEHADKAVRRWALLCVAKLWENNPSVRDAAMRDEVAIKKVCNLLSDAVPEVRAAAVYALGRFFGEAGSDVRRCRSVQLSLGSRLLNCLQDGSDMVRYELLVAFSLLMLQYQEEFRAAVNRFSAAFDSSGRGGVQPDVVFVPDSVSVHTDSADFVFTSIYTLSNDPSTRVADAALQVLRLIHPDNRPAPATPTLSAAAGRPGVTHGPAAGASAAVSVAAASLASPALAGSARGGWGEDTSRPSTFDAAFSLDPSDLVESGVLGPANVPVSVFYQWSVQRFRRPSFAVPTDTAAPEVVRRKRAMAVRAEVLREAETHRAHLMKTFEQFGILESNVGDTSLLRFETFESFLAVVNENHTVNVWNWQDGPRGPYRFYNARAAVAVQTRVTALTMINENSDRCLLALGSNDGIVRLWSGWKSESAALVTAWRCINLAPTDIGPGLVWSWQPGLSRLVCGGQAGGIHLWDCVSECCTQSVPTMSEHAVTCMDSFEQQNGLFVAGFADGQIQLFDARLPPHVAPVTSLSHHGSYCINVALVENGTKIMSGELGGTVCVWDMAQTSAPIVSKRVHDRSEMTALAVHPSAPYFATGSEQQYVKIFDSEFNTLSTIKYHDGWLGQRIGPVSCLAFHPLYVMLAAGSTDPLVSVCTADSLLMKKGGPGIRPTVFS